MALIELDLYDVQVTIAPKMVIFGSADEISGESDTDAEPSESGPASRPKPDVEPNPLGLVLFVLGIGLAVWLGRRLRTDERQES